VRLVAKETTVRAKTNVLAVDHHPVFCEGVASIINRQPDMRVIAEANSGLEAIDLFRQHRPDVMVTDLRLPGMDGIEVTRTICQEFPGSKVLILTACDGDEDIYRSFQAGARGYLLKRTRRDDLIDAIRALHGGHLSLPQLIATRLAGRVPTSDLTSREREVLTGMIHGKSNKEIATRLFISEGTVKVHVNSLMWKLRADNRTQAVVTALRRGIVHLEDEALLNHAGSQP